VLPRDTSVVTIKKRKILQVSRKMLKAGLCGSRHTAFLRFDKREK